MNDSRLVGPSHQLVRLLQERLRWSDWEDLIELQGIEIDRPIHSTHPFFPEIVYPIDYGFVRGTLGTDGDELDVFVGTDHSGLTSAIFTTDHRRQDQECKLIYNATPTEIYLINGFINFNRSLMEGVLVLRRPMSELWQSQWDADDS